jgi:hypothetical protein
MSELARWYQYKYNRALKKLEDDLETLKHIPLGLNDDVGAVLPTLAVAFTDTARGIESIRIALKGANRYV